MQLRNGALTGGSRGQLPAAARPLFEEGVSLVFRRWTALRLALEGHWGGPASSDKAQAVYEETLDWFYKEQDHYSDDLGMDLEDSFEQDFNGKLEDGSPYEVAKVLVLLHDELLQGSTATLERLRSTAPASISSSRQEKVDRDGTVVAERARGEASSSSSSSDDDNDGDEDMEGGAMASGAAAVGQEQQPAKAPVIDEEGFELVQRRRLRGRPTG